MGRKLRRSWYPCTCWGRRLRVCSTRNCSGIRWRGLWRRFFLTLGGRGVGAGDDDFGFGWSCGWRGGVCGAFV